MHLLILWPPVEWDLCGGVLQRAYAVEQRVVGGAVRWTRAVGNGDESVIVTHIMPCAAQDVEVWLARLQLDSGRHAGKLDACVEGGVRVACGVDVRPIRPCTSCVPSERIPESPFVRLRSVAGGILGSSRGRWLPMHFPW